MRIKFNHVNKFAENTKHEPLSMSSIRWYISFLHFKDFKTQFHGVPPPLHHVLICKIHIYTPKMTFSSLLRQTSFYSKKFANFRYITCFVPNLILSWPQSHGLSTLKKVLEHFLSPTSYLILLLSV